MHTTKNKLYESTPQGDNDVSIPCSAKPTPDENFLHIEEGDPLCTRVDRYTDTDGLSDSRPGFAPNFENGP